jgi:hypothetical protein
MHVRLPFLLQKTKVYAFVGESGTGKSFHAKLVAHKYRISLMIDDGLLIKGDRIIAGRSAKEEKSYMGAVRAALFDSQEQRDEVAARLSSEKFGKILILGTSTRMIQKIAGRLNLPTPGKYIRIEEFATRDEIETALRTRRIEGKHVIPVPRNEVKRTYSSIFFDAIRVRAKSRVPVNIAVEPVHEESLVRPLYSKRERIIISEQALSQMALLAVNEFDADIRVKRISVNSTDDDGTVFAGYKLAMLVDVPDGSELGSQVAELQKYIISDIERFTGILIEEVNIILDKIA